MRIAIRILICSLASVSFVLSGLAGQSRIVGASHQDKGTYQRTGAEGTVSGRILFDGEPPTRKRINMAQDANCAEIAKNPRTEDLLVANGQVANAFVYVKGAEVDHLTFDVPATGVVLDQQQCRFVPRVLGLQLGQSLIIFNSDRTTHNIHPAPKVNQEWNQMQAQGAPPIEKTFSRVETLIPVKCNQHPWMKAFVGVLSHPFFAVSKKDGSFSINGLPPGAYTLVAWHETLGERTAAFSIGSGETKSLDVRFNMKTSGATSRNLEIAASLSIQ